MKKLKINQFSVVKKNKNFTIEYPEIVATSSHEASKLLRKLIKDISVRETFVVLFFKQNATLNGYEIISIGGTTSCIVDIKLICLLAINSLSQSVLLCHNHPSGSLITSDADNSITKKLVQALKMFDIGVRDHIVLTEQSYYSYADNGRTELD